jgi:hypothetical protein
MAFLPERTFLEENLTTNYDLSNGVTGFTSSDLSKYLTFNKVMIILIGVI